MREIKRIKTFWKWFEKNNHKFLFLNEVESEIKEKLLDEFIDNLHKYCEHIFFEIGGHPDDKKVELIITASGNIDYFDKVVLLVDNSPELKDWEIIAFKPPMEKGFKTEYAGRLFDPEKTIFIPLNNEDNPRAIGLQVCFSDYNEEDENVFINGTYLMLDTLLGERSTTLDIDYLKVIKTPDDISKYDFRHLCDLKEYIVEKKNVC